MPRFFFHDRDGHEHHDSEGTELPSLAQARKQGLLHLSRLLQTSAGKEDEQSHWSITVTDASGLTLFLFDAEVTHSAAVRNS